MAPTHQQAANPAGGRVACRTCCRRRRKQRRRASGGQLRGSPGRAPRPLQGPGKRPALQRQRMRAAQQGRRRRSSPSRCPCHCCSQQCCWRSPSSRPHCWGTAPARCCSSSMQIPAQVSAAQRSPMRLAQLPPSHALWHDTRAPCAQASQVCLCPPSLTEWSVQRQQSQVRAAEGGCLGRSPTA